MICALTIALLAQAPVRVACVGDSITFGIGTRDAATQSYPVQLQHMLGARYTIGDFGHSGATLSKEGDLPYWSVPEFKAAMDFQPQIVTIMLGTNDARSINWPKSKDFFVPEFKELIADFRALPSHPKVYICLPPPDFEKRKEVIDEAIVPLVKQVARETDAPLIDAYAILDGRGDLFHDGLHPDEIGAGMIAQTIGDAIEDPVERKKGWRVVSVDSEEPGEGPAKFAIDGDPETYWHTNYSTHETKPPHEIVVDMGKSVTVTAFRYLPRQDGGVNGRVRNFELYLSEDGKTWGEPVLTGELKDSGSWSRVPLPRPVPGRFFKFKALSEWRHGPWTSAAELDVDRQIGP